MSTNDAVKCRRCVYNWIPMGMREIKGTLYWVDLGRCPKCGHATSRVGTASPGEQVAAMLWGEQRFEVLRQDHGEGEG